MFPAKYRRAVFDEKVDGELEGICSDEICLDMEIRYQLQFLEVGTDRDQVDFFVQSVPTYDVTKLVVRIKRLRGWEIFRCCPEVKRKLWGGEYWSDGYVGTVGKHGDELMTGNDVNNQGGMYQKSHGPQLTLFWQVGTLNTPLPAAGIFKSMM